MLYLSRKTPRLLFWVQDIACRASLVLAVDSSYSTVPSWWIPSHALGRQISLDISFNTSTDPSLQDCSKIVASKFFPVPEKPPGQYPLCETDYFRRLDLLCFECGQALRGSYITALDRKYHI